MLTLFFFQSLRIHVIHVIKIAHKLFSVFISINYIGILSGFYSPYQSESCTEMFFLFVTVTNIVEAYCLQGVAANQVSLQESDRKPDYRSCHDGQCDACRMCYG